MKSTKKILSIDKLHAFENHPYKVQDNEEMEDLAESIKEHGIVSPVIVRPLENTTDEYEIISGHRRVMASRKAGITEVPALIVSLDRDAAAIVLVDSNLHREHIPQISELLDAERNIELKNNGLAKKKERGYER